MSSEEQVETPSAKSEIATLAGGCFWCMEPLFEKLAGIKEVISGYTGGHKVNLTGLRSRWQGRAG